MILRYIGFVLIINVLFYILNIFIYPIAYTFRSFFRENKLNMFARFFWWFLHDGNDYGDIYFQNEHKSGETKLDYFLLSYRWSFRNPTHNLYFSLKPNDGNIITISNKTTCNRPDVNDDMWRTLKFKDFCNVYKDKHGDYIDYNHSILGKQRYIFKINNLKYFRYSGTTIKHIKFLKKLFIREYKFGFAGNWTIQHMMGFKNADEKAIREYNDYCKIKI